MIEMTPAQITKAGRGVERGVRDMVSDVWGTQVSEIVLHFPQVMKNPKPQVQHGMAHCHPGKSSSLNVPFVFQTPDQDISRVTAEEKHTIKVSPPGLPEWTSWCLHKPQRPEIR